MQALLLGKRRVGSPSLIGNFDRARLTGSVVASAFHLAVRRAPRALITIALVVRRGRHKSLGQIRLTRATSVPCPPPFEKAAAEPVRLGTSSAPGAPRPSIFRLIPSARTETERYRAKQRRDYFPRASGHLRRARLSIEPGRTLERRRGSGREAAREREFVKEARSAGNSFCWENNGAAGTTVKTMGAVRVIKNACEQGGRAKGGSRHRSGQARVAVQFPRIPRLPSSPLWMQYRRSLIFADCNLRVVVLETESLKIPPVAPDAQG